MINCYEILNVKPDDEFDQILKAFNAKASLYHPKSNKPEASRENFLELFCAFKILSSKYKTKYNLAYQDRFIKKIAQKSRHEKYIGLLETLYKKNGEKYLDDYSSIDHYIHDKKSFNANNLTSGFIELFFGFLLGIYSPFDLFLVPSILFLTISISLLVISILSHSIFLLVLAILFIGGGIYLYRQSIKDRYKDL